MAAMSRSPARTIAGVVSLRVLPPEDSADATNAGGATSGRHWRRVLSHERHLEGEPSALPMQAVASTLFHHRAATRRRC